MPSDQPAPSMELAEFFAKIMLDAFEGVREASRLQEEKVAELSAAASLDAADFARLTVTSEALDDELARLFPSPDATRPHAVYVGAPYRPALKDDETESPPFKTVLGIQLGPEDYSRPRRSRSFVLAPSAVQMIQGEVHAQLGAQAQVILRNTLARGLSRLIVDSGKISAKISLTVQAAESSRAGPSNSVPAKGARILVRVIDDRAPQTQKLRVDVVSELEVTFKTVS